MPRVAPTTDERYMAKALVLAARARGRTSPNPMVGSIIVRGDEVVGRGYHKQAGAEHAEVVALREAGSRAEGADLYVNLEPCNHRGRTGPCTRTIIKAGVARVVVGMKDPNPLVNGKGIRAMRRKGVKVATGVLEQACRGLNEGFLCYIGEGRPLVTFKSAITLDGRVACRGGDAWWVTGPEALRAGHRMRDRNDAIMVGVGTVLADDATLTCRGIRGGRDPLRVVVDSRLSTPVDSAIIRAASRSSAATLVVCTTAAPARRVRALEAAGAEVLRLEPERGPRGKNQVPLNELLQALGKREIMTVMLEGGPRLSGAMWRVGLIDRVTAFVAPKILGDPRALPMMAAGEVSLMAHATELEDVQVKRLGRDLSISGRVPPRQREA